MQLIPFIFAIILAFFVIISRLSSENMEDAAILRFLKNYKNQEWVLLKKIERNQTRNLLSKKSQPAESHLKRPKTSSKENSKLSLRVLNAPIDEITKQYLKKLFLTILEKNYQDRATEEILNAILMAAKEQKTEELDQIDLKNLKLQKQYFSLLTDVNCPLGELFTLKTFEKNALFHFSNLKKGLFEEVLGQDVALKVYEIEKKFFLEFKQTIVPKEKWMMLLPTLSYQLNPVFMDRLICFKEPKKSLSKKRGDAENSVYTWIDE